MAKPGRHVVKSGEGAESKALTALIGPSLIAPIDSDLIGGNYSDSDRAERVLRFVSRLYESQGWTIPRFQQRFIREIFGTVHHPSGVRLYRWALLHIARKNFKSSMLAALGLYLLLADGEKDPKVFIASPSLDNCREIYEAMDAFLRDTPELHELLESGRLRIINNQHRKEITLFGENGRIVGYVAALTTGGKTKHGKNPSAVLFDEVHQLRDEELWRAMTTGSMMRRQPLWLVASTAGEDAAGLYHDLYSKAKKIIAGVLTDSRFLAYVYEADPDDDVSDPSTWRKANPALEEGLVPLVNFEAEYETATSDPRKMADFKRLNLNLWIGAHDAYLDRAAWAKAGRKIEDSELFGRPNAAGMDLSRSDDFTSFAFVFLLDRFTKDPDELRRYAVKRWIFTPKDTLKKRQKETGFPFERWAEQGLIEAIPGTSIDYKFVVKRFVEEATKYGIRELAIDPYMSTYLNQDLDEAGFEIFKFAQTYEKFTFPTKELRNLVTDGRLIHEGDEVLNWQASNLVVMENPNADVRPDKRQRSTKIDTVVCIIMALERVMGSAMEPPPQSLYSEEFGVFG